MLASSFTASMRMANGLPMLLVDHHTPQESVWCRSLLKASPALPASVSRLRCAHGEDAADLAVGVCSAFSSGTRLMALDLRNDTSGYLKPLSQARKTSA